VVPNAPIYFYKFTSPASSDVLFTTRFTIADAQGNSVPANLTETATDGSLVHYGIGALVDPTQGDQPPVYGTAISNATVTPSQTATSTVDSGSTSVPTPSGTNTFTTTSSMRANDASQTHTLGSVVLGALGALFGALLL